jgi:hypothetical protein
VSDERKRLRQVPVARRATRPAGNAAESDRRSGEATLEVDARVAMSAAPTIKPIGHGEPVMEIMFGQFVMWAFSEPEFRKAFEDHSGMKLPGNSSPLEAMIDKATGFQDAVLHAFIEWCIKEHWGEAETKENQSGNVL